ncbi:hypothetical protein [Burkholderia sp. Ac-20349]|uniref:hypothetical protein n=1 Tax=Burkholderia sp. Ac-20349 TaxID=2703893 RepID=UPI00197B91B1|nr:hypothetical protein [Burkholderia sp. Ac-20349]MBN3838876.1 hypothetical protein [Burkholderia sp. Ac-20349]
MDTKQLIEGLRAEQTYLGSCREARDDSGRIRWDRLQRVIDHLAASAVEQHEAAPAVELSNVHEALTSGKGFWRTCSGCYESEDGHPVGEYPYSEILQCDLGAGCAECSGIGAVWDNTDYDDLVNFLEQRESEVETNQPQQPSSDGRAECIVLANANGFVPSVEAG